MNRKTLYTCGYVSPHIERNDVKIEHGFASSILSGTGDNDGLFGNEDFGSGIFGADGNDDGFFE